MLINIWPIRTRSKKNSKYYKRESEVVASSLSDDLLKVPLNRTGEKNHYLSFGALVPYKRIDLLVEAFRHRKDKLIVVGEGSERSRLETKSIENVIFKGGLPWAEVQSLIETAKALLFPGEEDFGIIPLEAMALGCPVIALVLKEGL